MSTALAVYEQFDTLQRAAKALHASGYFSDARDLAQAVVKVMAGAELGLAPFASMTGIHVIKGKPVLGSNLIATLIQSHPRYDFQVTEHTDERCTIAFYVDGSERGATTFTMDDAKRAGLLGNANWKNYPKNMLFARAISNGARFHCPAVFAGAPVYTPDEMGAMEDADGNIIDVVAEPVEREPEPVVEPSGNGSADGRYWQTVADKVPYYSHARHAEATAKKLGIPYPTNSAQASQALDMLRDYAEQRIAEKVGGAA